MFLFERMVFSWSTALLLNRLNLIRTISCLLIATFHVVNYLNMQARDVQLAIGWLAAPGFHLFLLMSGVVLSYTTKPNDRPSTFMIKRVARMAPLYWLMTLAAVGLAIWRPWTFSHVELNLEHIAKSLLFIPYADMHGRMMPILYVGWALNYTMLFYVFFALSLMVERRWRTQAIVAALVSMLLAARLLPESDLRRFFGDPILLEFAVGAVIGRLVLNDRVSRWIKSIDTWPYFAAGAIAMFATAYVAPPPVVGVTLYSLAGALILTAATGADLYKTPLKSKTIEWLGALSYAILLVHPLLIPLIAAPLEARIPNEWARLAIIVPVFLAASIGLAHLAHIAVEKPMNAWLRGMLSGGRKPKAQQAPAH